MTDNIVIDRNTRKMMSYLYRHGETLYSVMSRKFGEDTATFLCELCRGEYAAHRKEDLTITFDTSIIYEKSRIALTVKGNKYVEDYRQSQVITYTPIFVSVVSLMVSIVGLIISIS